MLSSSLFTPLLFWVFLTWYLQKSPFQCTFDVNDITNSMKSPRDRARWCLIYGSDEICYVRSRLQKWYFLDNCFLNVFFVIFLVYSSFIVGLYIPSTYYIYCFIYFCNRSSCHEIITNNVYIIQCYIIIIVWMVVIYLIYHLLV